MTVGLIYHAAFLEHDTGPSHPERPQRLGAIMHRLDADGLLARLTMLPFEPAALPQVYRVHDSQYVDRLVEACHSGATYIDARDSAICHESYDIALLAAGGALAAVEAVWRGTVDRAFCAIRPPGHHAERDRSMGFCMFNNVAVAAEHLIHEHGLSRIAIVDFDVHHGNGTQHTFERRSDVLFISIHEHPQYLYPGTGFADETGIDEGEGYTINLPLRPESGDDEYMDMFDTRVLPAMQAYKPQFLLVSAGFDAAATDPLAHMNVTTEGFAWMTRQLRAVADTHCEGKLVSLLEGGYDLDALAAGVAAHIGVLME